MISVSELAFRYGDQRVLADISFALSEGEIVSFLGKSGCGKTTLLKCLAGLIVPQHGTIRIEGMSPFEAARAQKIGYMFQEDSLLGWRSVWENVALPFEIAKVQPNAANAEEAIRLALDMVGLLSDAHRFPHELSGGMRQRTALARSLAPRPAVMLLDEPFAALDLLTREQIMIDLHAIFKKAGTPVVIVTHHVEEAVFLSDRICVLGGSPSGIAFQSPSSLPTVRDQDLLSTEAFTSKVIEIKQAIRDGKGGKK